MHKELFKFLIVGSITFLVDFFTYTVLVSVEFHPSPSKFFSFLAGTCFSYYANKNFTFKENRVSDNDSMRFCLLYGFSLLVNVGVNYMTLQIFGESSVQLAFFTATAASTIINFFGQKFWVFKDSHYTS
ncbi:MAG: GtrA family protein [Bdellovibrionales bacterium]|nr:GtrA family protein [Bdellovibrionales bacterium]